MPRRARKWYYESRLVDRSRKGVEPLNLGIAQWCPLGLRNCPKYSI